MQKLCLFLLPFFLSCAFSVPPFRPFSEASGLDVPVNVTYYEDAAENVPVNKDLQPLPDRSIPVRSGIVVNGNATIQFFLSGGSRPSIVKELDDAIFSTPIGLTRPQIHAGYTIFAKGDGFVTAYKFQQSRKTWNQARKICAQEGAYLAYPNSALEEAAIQRIKTLNKVDYIWIGVHDLFEEGDWTTVLGESLQGMSYVNWIDGEPNNHNGEGEEHCGALAMNGINDVPCKQMNPYICKIDLKY